MLGHSRVGNHAIYAARLSYNLVNRLVDAFLGRDIAVQVVHTLGVRLLKRLEILARFKEVERIYLCSVVCKAYRCKSQTDACKYPLVSFPSVGEGSTNLCLRQ